MSFTHGHRNVALRLTGAVAIVALLLTAGLPLAAAPSPTNLAKVSQPSQGWSAAGPLEPVDPSPFNQFDPKIAADSAGNLLFLWSDYREGSNQPHVRYSYKPAGGAWQPSAKLDPAGSGTQWRPTVAMDGSDNAYAAWVDGRSGALQIYFAYRPAGGDWGAGAPVGPTPGRVQLNPDLVVNQRGDALLVWLQGETGGFKISVARRPAGDRWRAAVNLTPAVLTRWTDVAAGLDDWGRGYALWVGGSGSQYEVLCAARSAEGT